MVGKCFEIVNYFHDGNQMMVNFFSLSISIGHAYYGKLEKYAQGRSLTLMHFFFQLFSEHNFVYSCNHTMYSLNSIFKNLTLKIYLFIAQSLKTSRKCTFCSVEWFTLSNHSPAVEYLGRLQFLTLMSRTEQVMYVSESLLISSGHIPKSGVTESRSVNTFNILD